MSSSLAINGVRAPLQGFGGSHARVALSFILFVSDVEFSLIFRVPNDQCCHFPGTSWENVFSRLCLSFVKWLNTSFVHRMWHFVWLSAHFANLKACFLEFSILDLNGSAPLYCQCVDMEAHGYSSLKYCTTETNGDAWLFMPMIPAIALVLSLLGFLFVWDSYAITGSVPSVINVTISSKRGVK